MDNVTADLLKPEIKAAVAEFMEFSKSTGIFIVPLKSDGEVIGHLVFEFLEGHIPDQLSVLNFINVAPFFGAALAKRWVLSCSPHLVPLTEPSSWRKRYLPDKSLPTARLAAVVAGIVLLMVLFFPIPYNVGGEAEVVPRHRHVAFCQVEGIVQQIMVNEGSQVQKGQVVASLDPTELNHKITMARRQIELLRNEAEILQKLSHENISKLAESQLSVVKIRRSQAELDFLLWQLQFLQIKAPADGVVVTKQVQTQIGKKFSAGEPFCEIATPGDLCAEIYVPEDRIVFVKVDQAASLYLNSDPSRRYDLRIIEAAPKSDAIARLGNVYRVRGSFSGDAPKFSVGQKGTGSISAGYKSISFIVGQRIGARWKELTRQLW